MANAFFTPFNNQPTSVTFHSTPVTLGADEYAKLIIMPQNFNNDKPLGGDQSLTIDGNMFYPQTHWYSSDWDQNETMTCPTTGVYTFWSNNGQHQINVLGKWGHDAGTAGHFHDFIGGGTTDGTGSGSDMPQLYLPRGAQVVKDVGTLNGNIHITCEPSLKYEKTCWLPPSTVISSGDGSKVINYMLERYSTYS